MGGEYGEMNLNIYLHTCKPDPTSYSFSFLAGRSCARIGVRRG
jgi:hypothetical protein